VKNKWIGATLGTSLIIACACGGYGTDEPGECELPPPPVESDRSGAKKVAPVNRGAIVGYDSVDAEFDIVDDYFPDVRGCETAHSQPLTNAAGNRVDGSQGDPYRHIDKMSFIPSLDDITVGDLFLHGDGKGYLAIRSVDFRRFLYQDIVLSDCDTEKCDKQGLPGKSQQWKNAEPAPKGYGDEPFDSDRFDCIRNVHGFFAEFNRIAKRIKQRDGNGDLRLHLTNNCREPGNYEIALVSEKKGKLFKDHVSLDIAFYTQVLEAIDVDLGELGTGLRVVGAERRADGSYVYEDVEPKEFPAECSLVNLAPYVGRAQRLLTSEPIAIDVQRGAIPYDQFSIETNEKSGLTGESIVYVEVEKKAPPEGFESQGFWFQKASDGVIERYNEKKSWKQLVLAEASGGDVHAPHTFATFADALKRPFAISAFEVDGRYLGRMKDERLLDDTLRLYGFDYSYLRGLKTAEVRVAINKKGKPDTQPPRMEFRLLNDRCTSARCVNLVVGNIKLEPGEQTSMVLGIGTQPLLDNYENGVFQEYQQYALTYDDKGEFTELVGDYGLGLAVIRRSKDNPNEYTIDLVAYERAVPLWRGIIDVKGGRPPATSGRKGRKSRR